MRTAQADLDARMALRQAAPSRLDHTDRLTASCSSLTPCEAWNYVGCSSAKFHSRSDVSQLTGICIDAIRHAGTVSVIREAREYDLYWYLMALLERVPHPWNLLPVSQ